MTVQVTLRVPAPVSSAFKVGARVDLDRHGALVEWGHYEIVAISEDRLQIELVPVVAKTEQAA